MSHSLLHRLGHTAILRTQTFSGLVVIFLKALEAGVTCAFMNRAVRQVLLRQIYFTAVQACPFIGLAALVLGAISAHYLFNFLDSLGAHGAVAGYLTQTMFKELAPLASALLIMVRSGPAVTSEIALMKINKEFQTLRMLHVSVGRYIFFTRVAAFAVAGLSLALLFTLVGLVGSFLVLGYIHDIALDTFLEQVVHALEFDELFTLAAKPCFMAVAVALASLDRGMAVGRAFTEVPVKLIQGMILSIALVLTIEIGFVFLDQALRTKL